MPDANPITAMTNGASLDSPPAAPQAVVVPLTRDTIFLTLTAKPDDESLVAIRSLCPDLPALVRAVGFREPAGNLSCVIGFGSAIWDRLFGDPRPAELHPFREIRAGARHAVATPGDVFFHIRAEREDMCFELATVIISKLGDAVTPVDEVHGFRYFDARDLLGFVDGTENPVDQEATSFAIVGGEDPSFTGGSYVIVQKYLHDLTGWNALPTEAQERIIGRTKLADVELDDAIKPTSAHNALTTIVENGQEQKILRENMAFGQAGHGEFGTYFIGYSRTPRTTELMLENMFIGRPPGNYDRILDFSRAVTGALFFVPSQTFLDAVTPDAPAAAAVAATETESSPAPVAPRASDGSLGIGSLKGKSRHE
jgi:putative iron-dependent peroxidase